MHLPSGSFPVLFLIFRWHTNALSFPYNLTRLSACCFACPEGADELVAGWELLLGRVSRGRDRPAQEGGTYLGFKEVLGTFDALQGNIDLRKLRQRHQPTVFL